MERYETEVAQDIGELTQFTEILKRENARSYLEIGSRYGGSLWRVARALPKGSRIVAVDLPEGFGGRADGQRVLSACIEELCRRGYEAQVFWGDSTDTRIVEKVRQLAPFDAVFIDAHHMLPYVTADWNNYGQMARIVAFHDIAWRRPEGWKGRQIEVPLLWNEIKNGYRFEEFKLHKTGQDNGIGVLWRR